MADFFKKDPVKRWHYRSIPASWKLMYKEGDNWIPVKNTVAYEIAKDRYNTVKFEPVKTKALRIEVQLPQDHATGVHEWKVK